MHSGHAIKTQEYNHIAVLDSTQAPCLQPPVSSSGKSPNHELSEVMREGIRPERTGLVLEFSRLQVSNFLCCSLKKVLLFTYNLKNKNNINNNF